MRINHNLMAMNAHRQLQNTNYAQKKSMEKLSSGLRINRAGDDAAGLAISEKMRAQIRGLNQASRNASYGIDLIQNAEGALNESHAILQRMRELADQAASDTNVTVDRSEIQKEMNQLSSEINRIGNTTEYNTMSLLEGSRANTLTTFTGNFGSASGASTADVSGSVGVDNVSFTGTSLTSGSHSLEISVAAEDHADQSVSDADFTISGGSSMNNGDLTFSGGVTLANVNYTSGSNLVFTVEVSGSDNYLHIQSSGASGAVDDYVKFAADGSLSYNNFGISFDITSLDSGVVDGAQMFFSDAVTSGAGSLGTVLEGYDAANTGENDWVTDITIGTPNSGISSGSFLPDQKIVWTIQLSGDGESGFFISGTGQSGTVINDVFSGVDLTSTSFTYNNYGLNFTIGSGTGISGATGDKVQFTTTPTYTWNATVDGSGSTAIASGQSGGATVTATDFQVGGIEFDSSGLSTGSGSFTVFTEGSSGTDNSLNFQIGANQNQSMALSIGDMRANSISITAASGTGGGAQVVNLSRAYEGITSGSDNAMTAYFTSTKNVTDGTNATDVEYALDVSTHDKAAAAVTVINDAIEQVSSERSKLGAVQNRLEHTIKNLDTSAENLQASESTIRDVDMAKEMMNYTKQNILSQAATSMLAQANQAPQGVLQLLG